MPTPKEIQRLSYEKAVKLERLIDALEKRISTSSSELTKIMLKQFVNKLNTQQGRIISEFNKQTLTLFNEAFKRYQNTTKNNLVNSIIEDIDNILEDNHKFYRSTVEKAVDKSDIKKLINRRLGINDNGSLVREGYMNGLLDDTAIRSEIQKHVFREIFKQSGFESFKESLKILIEGETEKFGLFQKHYKTFSYDAYAQLNSFTSATYAQKLGLSHFIYNGGLIKTSREFCKKRNAEVFSTQEAEKWKDDPTLEAIDNRETYNWLIDRGGYNCRHTIDFIADEVAFVLRPELKK